MTGQARRLGDLPASSISPAAAEKIYDKLRRSGTVTRQANYTIDVARAAWKDVSRQHPRSVWRSCPALGAAVVLLEPQKGTGRKGPRTPRLYSESHAQHLVQRARALAGLPAHITLEACQHGGLTELGDAEVTGVMALSGHKTPSAARLYVKRTEAQRLTAARKRRAYINSERNGSES